MAQLYRMPDLPEDYVRYLDGDPDYIIFKEQYFIKRIRSGSANIEPLLEVADLDIVGFNNHKRVFQDDCEQYIYLNAPYLSEYSHTDLAESLSRMTPQDILRVYKELFASIKRAHENGLNPYDVKFSNYKLSQDGTPIFIDFDFVIYKGTPTRKELCKNNFPVKHFDIEDDITNPVALNLSDKLLAFKMLLRSLVYNYEILSGSTVDVMEKLYKKVLLDYELDPVIKEYLDSIILDYYVPTSDDYFIDTLVEPLSNGGLILKNGK